MAKTTAGTPGTTGDVLELPFEEALRKLESIVQSMEGEELPLESLLSHFEEGSRLAQVCQAKLAQAELKIHQLEKNSAGQTILKPMSAPEEQSRT